MLQLVVWPMLLLQTSPGTSKAGSVPPEKSPTFRKVYAILFFFFYACMHMHSFVQIPYFFPFSCSLYSMLSEHLI